MSILRRGLTLVAGVVALLVVAGLGFVWQASPKTSGTVLMHGVQGEVRIDRDAHGIPTIRAGGLHDLMFGLGVVHAQDRLWQLETHRRIGAGQLAEAFGEAAVDTDRFLRALGVHRAAQAQWAQTPAESRLALEAYAKGVNAAIASQGRVLPPEFLILGVRPQPWAPSDSLAWALMMAWDLGGNWNAELMRLRLALKFPLQRVHELMPPHPGSAYPNTRDLSALYRELGLDTSRAATVWLDLPDIAPASGVEGVGSNNWVLAPSRSATGGPLLANDPHLKLSAPALWYFVRLEAPGLKAAGASMPGVPSIVLGQNERIAWGMTNTGPDVQDLYIERLKPDDATQVATPDGWAPLWTRQEVIRVKGRPDVKMTVRASRHGPILSDAGTGADLLGASAGAPPRHVLALRWAALEPDADPVGAGLAMLRSASVDEFVAASARWVAPMQNMVVADASGRIGFVAAGRVPMRKPANDVAGLAPVPGWDARYDWDGWRAASATPRAFDPPRGWLATANQRIQAADDPHPLTHDWSAPWRYWRIEQLLQQRERHTLEDLGRMQADQVSLAARSLWPALERAAGDSSHALAAAVRVQLAGWAGEMDPQRAAPLIHWAWVRHLTLAVLADEFGGLDAFAKVFPSRSFHDAIEGILARGDAYWCDDKTTPAAETCEQMAVRALEAAVQELSARFGPDPAAWRWAMAHVAVSEHRPFSRVKALAPVFALRTPVGGDTHTVDAMRVVLRRDPLTADLYHTDHGPSLRALYDVANPRHSRVMHSSGQSGLPWSTLYRSFMRPWTAGDSIGLWADAHEAASGASLLIRPAPPP